MVDATSGKVRITITPPKPTVPIISLKAPIKSTLHAIQRYINEFHYNYTGKCFILLRKDKGMKHLIFSAKEIMRASLPIQCVESLFVAVHLTNGIRTLFRIPISFTSVAEGKEYHHMVLGVSHSEKWGAVGISRLKRLMFKPLNYSSLLELMKDFEDSYEFYHHKIMHIDFGLPFSHDCVSETPLLWKAVRIELSIESKTLDDYSFLFSRLLKDLSNVAYFLEKTGSFPPWFDETYRTVCLLDMSAGLCSIATSCFVVAFAIFLRLFYDRKRNSQRQKIKSGNVTLIAFFHPQCAGGGGGERVLWKAIQALQELGENGFELSIAVYTSDVYSSSYRQDVLLKVKERFSIDLFSPMLDLRFVHIPRKTDPLTFRRLSLVAEALDTIKLAFYAINLYTPDIFIDSTGCAFTFIVAKLIARCRIMAYVHYPTISTDMLNLVWERRPTYNNSANISRSIFFTYLKLVYYIVFALIYGLVGSLADLVLVNSTWTYNHIHFVWFLARNRTHILYPPCDTDALNILDAKNRKRMILSIGQFRSEKDHIRQIRAFARFLNDDRYKGKNGDVKLVLLGSCRGETDESLVKELKELTVRLGVSKSVEFVINQKFEALKNYLATSSIGLHTMWNEHFGIGVVEMMAAGLITIAHNSGGPKSDIINVYDGGEGRGRTGYLARSEEEYSNAMNAILNELSKDESEAIRKSAQISSQRFSDRVFKEAFKGFAIKLFK